MRARSLASLLVWLAPEPAHSDDVQWELTYTADTWTVLSGGVDQGSAYLDNLDLTIDIDAESLWGWEGVQFLVYGLYNNGNELSSSLVGDAQVISNIETGVRAARLYEAWVNIDLPSDTDLRFGLYDLNSEFDALESSGLFLGSAHGIGTDFSQSGENGPSIFPVTSLALRIQKRVSDQWTVRAAVLDGVPGDPDRPKRTAVRLGGDDGALVVAELQRESGGLRTLYGAWGYTQDIDTGFSRKRNYGAYLRGEYAFRGEHAGTSVFARVGVARDAVNPFSQFLSAGLTWKQFSARRPDDEAGIAFATAFSADSAGPDAAGHETAIELTYRWQLNERIAVQPNLQYVINPGVDRQLGDALAAGVRMEIRLH